MNAQAGTPAITRVRLSQTTDANGNASMTVDGYNVQQPGMWNLFLSVQGSAIVSVLEDGNPISGGPATNGSYDGGPIYTNGNSSLTVNVTGATPNTPVSGVLRGVQSNNPADLVSFVAPGYSTVGATQDNPASLLVGQVGPPLLENFTQSIPANSSIILPGANTFYNMAGYGAILLTTSGVSGSSISDLIGQLQWADMNGNVFAWDIMPGFYTHVLGAVFAAKAQQLSIIVENQNAVNAETITGLTVIPLVSLPTTVDKYIGPSNDIFQGDPKVLISANPSVGFGTTSVVVSNSIWPSRAIFNVSANSPLANYNCELDVVDSLGNTVHIATLTNNFAPPVEVELPWGQAQISFHNTASSGTESPKVSLVATG